MREYTYVFSDRHDWQALIDACLSIKDHTNSPSKYILGVLVSNLHTKESMLDGSLVAGLLNYLNNVDNVNKIMNCAVTLYVNMTNELMALNLDNALSYFIKSADTHIMIGMYLP